MHGVVTAIEYVLPAQCLTTEELSLIFPEWSVAQIDNKTGISCRHIAAPGECASDLAYAAAAKLFQATACNPQEIDYLLLCTQSPDYVLPTTACLLQNQLGISESTGAIDFNLGCSGFVYGLGLAEGLIATRQASVVLLITAETYSKYLRDDDKSTRTIFGDAAAATLIRGYDRGTASLGPFEYGTDGAGGNNLIVRNSGARRSSSVTNPASTNGVVFEAEPLFMDGAKVFSFAVRVVPQCVMSLLTRAHMTLDDIDLFVFHQANAFILEEIRNVLKIPKEKIQITMSHCANTVSSTIPIALKHAAQERRLRAGDTVMIAGFGVGYSWGASLIRWGSAFEG